MHAPCMTFVPQYWHSMDRLLMQMISKCQDSGKFESMLHAWRPFHKNVAINVFATFVIRLHGCVLVSDRMARQDKEG